MISALHHRYWIFVRPDVQKPIGGIKQIHRLCEALSCVGVQATLVQDSADFHPGWFKSSVNTISYQDWLNPDLTPLDPNQDVVIFPETYLPEIQSLSNNLPIVIFNQNVSYSFGLPQAKVLSRPSFVLDLYRSPLVRHVICVSEYDYSVLTHGFGLPASDVSLVVNGIESEIFLPSLSKKPQICYMPRKNKLDSLVVSEFLRRHPRLKRWRMVAIDKCSHEEVVSVLRKSLIFLSFGHPEGFGLPVAEAMACGCGVIGYDGLGGRELFKFSNPQLKAYSRVGIGDWVGFVDAISEFDRFFNEAPDLLSQELLQVSNSVRRHYSFDSMVISVRKAVLSIARSLSL